MVSGVLENRPKSVSSPTFLWPQKMCSRRRIPQRRTGSEKSGPAKRGNTMFNKKSRVPTARLSDAVSDTMRTTRTFFGAFVRAPMHVGSVCPSSRALALALIRHIPVSDKGVIVDLGAGSGSVSEELLRCGVAPEKILAVEISEAFAELFVRRCPNVPLAIGDARRLGNVLDRHAPGRRVCGIISSLPFRVMPSECVAEILREIRKVLQERGGSFVQYTYALWMNYPLAKYGFCPHAGSIVLKNLPPARIESYRC